MAKISKIPKHVDLTAIRDEWIAVGLATGPGDRQCAESAIRTCYRQAQLPAGVYELISERDYDPSEYQRRVID